MSRSEMVEFFDSIAKILLRCVVLGFLLLVLWAGCYVLLSGPIYAQAEYFGLSHHEVDVIFYSGIGFTKICVLLFFLFPYIAIRLVLRRKAQ